MVGKFTPATGSIGNSEKTDLKSVEFDTNTGELSVKTEDNDFVTNLDGRYATTQHVDNQIDKIVVSGRNLFEKTASFLLSNYTNMLFDNYTTKSILVSELFRRNKVRKINKMHQGFRAAMPPIIGSPVVISFWAKTNGQNIAFINKAFEQSADPNNIYTKYSNDGNLIGDGLWHQYFISNPKGMYFGQEGTGSGFVEFFEKGRTDAGNISDVFLSSFKTEIATHPSDWSYAPEDIHYEFYFTHLKILDNVKTSDMLYSMSQNGRRMISEGTKNIVVTIDGPGGFTGTYQKGGTGNITFVPSPGKTLIQVNGTNVIDGAKGSEATVCVTAHEILLTVTNVKN